MSKPKWLCVDCEVVILEDWWEEKKEILSNHSRLGKIGHSTK
jgi:hypothetical protein